MKPTFVLQVYNPELYKAQNNEPMPILLTRSEYWELAEVDGLDPSFCGLDVETTSDKVGKQNITTTYDGRNISFTVSLFTPHIDDSLEFFSRYLVTGVYAILRVVENSGLYLKCKIANYEFNRWTNGAEVTINLQAMDRFWHFDNTEAEEGNGFYVVSDVETKPYITDTTIVSPGVDGYTLNKIIFDVSHEKIVPSNYGADITIKTDTQRIVFSGIGYSVVAESKIHLEIDSAMPAAYFYLGTSKVDMTAKVDLDDNNQEGYEVWDWTLKPGYSKISAKYLFYNTTTGATLTIQAGLFDIQTRPKFVTYPKGLTSSETFTLSPYLVPENIAVGVTILGVEGTYTGGREIYTGETTVVPSDVVQVLQTGGYMLDSNITVKAISPVLDGATIENEVTTTDPTEGYYTNMIYISKKKQKAYLRGYINKSGWYNVMYSLGVMGFAISKEEQAKIIPENIAAGVAILGVEGTAAESIMLNENNSGPTTGYNLQYYIKSLSIIEPYYPTGLAAVFACMNNLTTLNLSGINTDNTADMWGLFYDCTALTNVTWGDNWGSNEAMTMLDVSECPLSHDSCLDLLNKLATKTTTATLTLSSTTKGYMSDDEIAIATAKGWTIA